MKILQLIFAIPVIMTILSVQIYAQTPCSPATAQVDLDINNVRAKILNGGDMWWDAASNPGYEIPKGNNIHSIFAGAFWIGGVDGSGQLKVASQTYRQTGDDFWPGPLDLNNAQTDSATCQQFDKIWKINRQDVIDVVNGVGAPTPDMLSYPGNGDVTGGQAQFLAPFIDFNNNGIYEPTLGDVPKFPLPGSSNVNCCDRLLGDQALWWVFNDAGNLHTNSNSAALGIEVQAMAYAYNGIDSIMDNTTFYQYKIINRSSNTFYDTYIGQWVDVDVGNFNDDQVGCDVMRGLGYGYNGDANDDAGYGPMPPSVGIDWLRGPLADPQDGIDNNLNGIIDEPNETISMTTFLYYNNVNASPLGNPDGAIDYYRFLQGIWIDGQPVTYGGDGRNPNNPVTTYMFPDDTDPSFPGQVWNQINANPVPSDRRFVMGSGKFTFQPGEVQCINFAVVWARTDTATSGLISVPELQAASDHVQVFFDNLCDSTLFTNIEETELDFGFNIYPNPAQEYVIFELDNDTRDKITIELFNISGKMILKADKITNTKIKFNTSTLSSGIYVYKITKQITGQFRTGKLIIN